MSKNKMGYIHPDVADYFEQQYNAQPIKVVPGHWPNMYTKEDVDKWLKTLDLIKSTFDDLDNLKDDIDEYL